MCVISTIHDSKILANRTVTSWLKIRVCTNVIWLHAYKLMSGCAGSYERTLKLWSCLLAWTSKHILYGC